MSGVTPETIAREIGWLDGWGGAINFDEATWTKGEDGKFDGGCWLVGRVKATGEYIEAKYVLAEATIGDADEDAS